MRHTGAAILRSKSPDTLADERGVLGVQAWWTGGIHPPVTGPASVSGPESAWPPGGGRFAVGEMVQKRIRMRDPELVINSVGTMDGHPRDSLFLPRLAASLFGLCGGIGLLIAAIGIYGVISFSVARRSREIGIRMALGG